MKTSVTQPGRIVLWIVLLVFAAWFPVQAQDDPNLLTNPGFEGAFRTLAGAPGSEIVIAEGWQPWHIGGGQSESENIQPDYYPASDEDSGLGVPRIREGEEAQQYLSFFATHDGGIFQRVTGITAGATLRFTAYVYVWSSRFNDPDVSEEPGGVVVQVGIDPTGGTSGESESIVWSDPVVEYDAYNEYTVTAPASGTAVTVFVRTTVTEPVANTNIYVDETSLVVVDDTAVSTSTAPATPTSEATATQQPTSQPATATLQPTATSTLTPTTPATQVPVLPTSTPIDLGIITSTPLVVPATETPVPTLTATASPTSTPTSTNTVAPTSTPPPTATPGATASSTPTSTNTATATSTAVPASPTPTPETLATAAPTAGTTPVSNEFPGRITHNVRPGDTVGALATLYGSTIEAIISANGLNQSALIRVGQQLIIPVRLPPPATSTPTITPLAPVMPTVDPNVPPQPPVGNIVYIVQPGDTLFRVAARFNTTATAIAQLNGITNINLIRVGQQLIIPSSVTNPPVIVPTSPPVQPTTYVVRPGDTLFRIALRFGVPLSRLIQVNGIIDPNRVFVGQVLTIP